MTPTIIILALIAAFLGLRLYSALGKHGQDQEAALPRPDDRPVPGPVLGAPGAEPVRGQPTPAQSAPMAYEPAAEIGIRAIFAADRAFDVGRFVNGAQAAYRMILEAFWRGDLETLRSLCDDDSYTAFADAIAARAERGETLENRLVTINSALIRSASVSNGVARIAVAFSADIVAITRGSDGRIIAGSMTDAVETHDVWGFSRSISSTEPNWVLDETAAD